MRFSTADLACTRYGHRGGYFGPVPGAGGGLPLYRPRNPRASTLYQLLDSYYETVKAVWEERFERRYGFWRGFTDGAVVKVSRLWTLRSGLRLEF